MQGSAVYIFDPTGQPVLGRETGEIFIGGVQVARGYLNRPDVTAERFVPDTHSPVPGMRMYRTGDVGAFMQDGSIEYLGRSDFQVKIRGYRVEPGEVESRLEEYPLVRNAIVIARSDPSGDTRLVAYYVPSDGTEIDGRELHAHLALDLPPYMVPSVYVPLRTLPLNTSGKLERNALPEPIWESVCTSYEAPSGHLEETVAAAWCEVLKLPMVGLHDDFFDLGGDSLKAMRVTAALRPLNIAMSVASLLRTRTLANFCAEVEHGSKGVADFDAALTAGAGATDTRLSFSQEQIWFLQRLFGANPAYNAELILWFDGELDEASLREALRRVVARHALLRTRFGERDGTPYQERCDIVDVPLEVVDLTRGCDGSRAPVRAWIDEAIQCVFDTSRAPLVRWILVRFGEKRCALVQSEHHFVHDGWSMTVLVRDIMRYYDDVIEGRQEEPPPVFDFCDYVNWQRSWLDTPAGLGQRRFWWSRLEHLPSGSSLPIDRPRTEKSFAGKMLRHVVEPATMRHIRQTAVRHKSTVYAFALAAFASFLAPYNEFGDVVLSGSMANRRVRGTEDMLGMFVNVVLYRFRADAERPFQDLLKDVTARVREAFENQEFPFEEVVKMLSPERKLGRNPLFDVSFAFHDSEMPNIRLGGIPGELEYPHNGSSKFDLNVISVPRSDGSLEITWEYDSDLFDDVSACRHLHEYVGTLESTASDTGATVGDIARSLAGRKQLVEWNGTDRAYASDRLLHELFEAQVLQRPDAVAVVYEDTQLSYGELDARASRLAHYLRTLGVGPDRRVALCVERSLELVVGILAVLKAGGAYVPLDPSYPPGRLQYMLDDSAPVAVVTHGAVGASARTLLDAYGSSTIDLDDAAVWADHPSSAPDRGELTPQHAAYVIYTSGSTGRPKGVIVEHRNVARLFSATQQWFEFGADDIWTLFHSYAFDFSVWELFGALLHGGRLIIVPYLTSRSPEAFYDLLCHAGGTVLNQTPSAFGQLIEAQRQSSQAHALRCVIFGGEALDTSMLAPWYEDARNGTTQLINMYGITETTVHVAYRPVASASDRGPLGSLIGSRIPDLQTHVLDAYQNPVPIGVAGELYVGGGGVARGYLNRPELAAERFVPDPFGGVGARLYRTGDLARYLSDGTLEFLGRGDFQVKIRGFRIELGEIEARLREHTGVREAVVVAREDTPGDKRLVAYYTSTEQHADASELRNHLLSVLPEYMGPGAYVQLEQLPLTLNGKLDRKALPAPDGAAYTIRAYEPPVGEIEEALASIWCDLLQVERVGRHDNFFELGGHSLLAVRLLAHLKSMLGIKADLAAIFGWPTLSGFAQSLVNAARSTMLPLVAVDRSEPLPLSFAQQRLWFLAQLECGSEAYHISLGLRLHGVLDCAALRRALDGIVARHESLRTTFVSVDGEPVQLIVPPTCGFALVEEDLRDRPDAVQQLIDQEASAPFDLERGPLIRGRLIALADDEYVLRLTMHHIVSDGWSMGVFMRELSTLYAAYRNGEADPLSPLNVQYADYAVWQRRWLSGDVLGAQASYWQEALSGAPVLLELPWDHARPAVQDHRGDAVPFELDAELSAKLRALSRRHGTTLFMTLLSAWGALLSRLTGQSEVVIGTPVANRTRPEIEGLIGFFVNTLALRLDYSGAPTVAEVLERVKTVALSAQEHQDLPFEQVVELLNPPRSLSHTPLFQSMFSWEDDRNTLALPALAIERLPGASRFAQFDLSLALGYESHRIIGQIEFASALVDSATIERWAEYLRAILVGIVRED